MYAGGEQRGGVQLLPQENVDPGGNRHLASVQAEDCCGAAEEVPT